MSAVPMFSLAERDRRWNVARAFMAREGLDVLLVFGEHEDAGPAPFGYDTWFTNGRAGTTVVFPRDGDPISLFPMEMFTKDHLESTRRGDIIWIPPENIRASRDSRAIADTFNELGLENATVGVVGLEPYPPWYPEGIVPYRLWNTILTEFPDVEIKPVASVLSRLIMPLGGEEIAAVRHSARIGDTMVRAMVNTAAPGVPESEVYAAGMAAGYARGTTPAAMHFWSGPDPLASGLPPWSYRPQAPRLLRNGDVISAEVFSNVGGRHTQHQATITIGEPHDDLRRAATVARAAYEACLQALRPGRPFGEVVDAMREPFRDAGGWEFGPSLHALNPMIALSGFPADASRQMAGADAYPPENDHPTLGADLTLQPGMTFALEPNYAFGRHMAYLGGTVIVGDNEPTELNPYTAGLLRATGTSRGQTGQRNRHHGINLWRAPQTRVRPGALASCRSGGVVSPVERDAMARADSFRWLRAGHLGPLELVGGKHAANVARRRRSRVVSDVGRASAAQPGQRGHVRLQSLRTPTRVHHGRHQQG